MSYLYIRYDKKQEHIFKDFEILFDFINFESFTPDENCRINFVSHNVVLQIDMFILEELKFEIADKIYSIDKNIPDGKTQNKKINLIAENSVKNIVHPKTENKSGMMLYKAVKNRDIFRAFVIDDSDIDDFASMLEKRDFRYLAEHTIKKVFMVYIKKGQLIRCIKTDNLSVLQKVCRYLSGIGEFYPQEDEDFIFEAMKNNKKYLFIAIYCLNFNTSLENFNKLGLSDEFLYYGNWYIDFFEDQVYGEDIPNFKKLSCLDLPLDDLASVIMKSKNRYVTVYLVNALINKLKSGHEISCKNSLILLNSMLPYRQIVEIFNLVFVKEILSEKKFGNIVDLIEKIHDSKIKNLAFDIMMERIEFDIEEINYKSCRSLLLYDQISHEREQKFIDFLLMTSKITDEKFANYLNTYKGGNFKWFLYRS